ncbi:MAG: hypothetical protein M1396_02140 [Chloroflexi bacterium]|nr:hypothetical protein [Chloroflexota bacterium]
MQLPAVLVSLLLATLYGLAFSLITGRQPRRMPLYCAGALVGFAGGFLIAHGHSLSSMRLGQIPLVESTLGSAVVLVFLLGLGL